MAPSRSVTRLAVDGQTFQPRLIRLATCNRFDLTAVAFLAGCQTRRAAQNAHRWPVATIGDGHAGRDSGPAAFRPCAGVAKPRAVRACDLEGQKPQAAIRMTPDKTLRAAADHMTRPDHAFDGVAV